MLVSHKVVGLAITVALSGLPILTQAHELGHHTMTGTITALNKHTGFMHLRTSMGTLVEHFPPSSESRLHIGERIKVYLGYKPVK
jgi:hypothetical protein